jgi:predicted CopG family antitoxin
MSSRKMIAISEKTYHNLAKLGSLEDSFDSVIARLIQKQKAASGQNPLVGSTGQNAGLPNHTIKERRVSV